MPPGFYATAEIFKKIAKLSLNKIIVLIFEVMHFDVSIIITLTIFLPHVYQS